ncbi:hypothetical protein ACFVS2_23500 [Brevibacillus sp. NPDC058079]|uniref:hypothetical protein n=1 Tax=Brevibacillus sp. NPDC058079 TaxID=3346330 RepID=UPI0036EB1C2E
MEETVRRSFEYNAKLAYKHMQKIGFTLDVEKLRREAEIDPPLAPLDRVDNAPDATLSGWAANG